ncbi:uncharacterized protein LOC135922940 isoform X3 [Gordionus sp. m RMFG-2023]|uniref:uncharacterized protein LOC135922940 isoform X3 n=1 Tax=Gordionus sp. m RMFG-2023 TaxID=3053472 RepID=UPI0031FC1952
MNDSLSSLQHDQPRKALLTTKSNGFTNYGITNKTSKSDSYYLNDERYNKNNDQKISTEISYYDLKPEVPLSSLSPLKSEKAYFHDSGYHEVYQGEYRENDTKYLLHCGAHDNVEYHCEKHLTFDDYHSHKKETLTAFEIAQLFYRTSFMFFKHFLYKISRFFYCLLCLRHTCSVSLTGLCLGITLGMFLGIYLETCTYNGSNFGEDYDINFYNKYPPYFPNKNARILDGVNGQAIFLDDKGFKRGHLRSQDMVERFSGPFQYRYHSAQEDVGYQPRRIIPSLHGDRDDDKLRPAGSVKLVRPYHLATELGIISKTAIVLIAREDESYSSNSPSPAALNDTETRLTNLLERISALETSLKRQFASMRSDQAFSGKTTAGDAFGDEDVFGVKDGSFVFHNSVADDFDMSSDTLTAKLRAGGGSPPTIGKILCFIRASSLDMGTVLHYYFPHLLPLLVYPKANKLNPKEDEGLALHGLNLMEDDNELNNQDSLKPELVNYKDNDRSNRKRSKREEHQENKFDTFKNERLFRRFVKIVALEADSPQDFVSATLGHIVDDYMHDFESVYIVKASGTYLRLGAFIEFAGGIRRGQDLYVGRPTEDQLLVGGPKEEYCSLNAGFFIGQSELLEVKNNLATCLDDIKSFEKAPESKRFQHILGTCISQILQRKCQTNINRMPYITSLYTADLTFNSAVNSSLLLYGLPTAKTGFKEAEVTDSPDQLNQIYTLLDRHYTDVDIAHVKEEINLIKGQLKYLVPFIPDAEKNIFFSDGIAPKSKPTNHFDVADWIYFNTSHVLLPNELETVAKLKNNEKLEITQIIHYGIAQFLQKYPNSLTYMRFVNGYKQNDPTRGIEYILDFDFLDTSVTSNLPVKADESATQDIKIISKRCHMMRPTGEPSISFINNNNDQYSPPQRKDLSIKKHQIEEGVDEGIDPAGDPESEEEMDELSSTPPILVRYLLLPVWARNCPDQALQALRAYTSEEASNSRLSIRSIDNARLLLIFLTLEPPSFPADNTNVSLIALTDRFLRLQADRLDSVKREAVALKRGGASLNLGWFTLPIPALLHANPSDLVNISDERLLESFVYNGSISIRILDAFAQKLHAKYGDDRYFPASSAAKESKTARYINMVTLLTLNVRIVTSPFFALARVNAHRGKRVCFPISYQRYDPSIARPTYEGHAPDHRYDIQELKTNLGHYDVANWGSAIFYLSDYLNARETLSASATNDSPFYSLVKWEDSMDTLPAHQPPANLDLAELFKAYANHIQGETSARQTNEASNNIIRSNQILDMNFGRPFELFRYIEPNLIMEHDPWEIVNCPVLSFNETDSDTVLVCDNLFRIYF